MSRVPKADFLITDKIYCLVRWHGISVGNHKVEFYWISPKKETQEYYKRAFVVGTSDRYDIWSWLSGTLTLTDVPQIPFMGTVSGNTMTLAGSGATVTLVLLNDTCVHWSRLLTLPRHLMAIYLHLLRK